MITFETITGYTKANQDVSDGNQLIRDGLKMMGNESDLSFEVVADYWAERMISEAIGSEAMDILGLWMWDYDTGKDIPDHVEMSSDLQVFYDTMLVPAMRKHYGSAITTR